jgi:hypothetical protein
LIDTLKDAHIDTSSLSLLFDTGDEQVHDLVVPGAEALAVRQRLRDLGSALGCWPLLLGNDQAARRMQETALRVTSLKTDHVLVEARTIDPESWFENRYLDEVEEVERRLHETSNLLERDQWRDLLAASGPLRGLPQGPWPEESLPKTRSSIVFPSADNEPLAQAHLALVPTLFGWQVPAYLRYGAWNNCPSAGEHVALFRYWEGRYGATLLGIADDVVELEVARPPHTREAALELARQHYLYCPDIVVQGTKTLQELAARLLDSSLWFFWWD